MESPPRGSLALRLRLPIGAAVALAVLVGTAATVLADCGNLDAATLTGTWQLRITVEKPTGTVPNPIAPVGTTAVETVALSSACTASGQCTAAIGSASAGSDVSLYDNSVGWSWGGSTVGLTQAANSYSGTTPRGGFGGPNLPPCPPPPQWASDTVTLTVLEATQVAAGHWQATVVSGTETSPVNWVCAGDVGETTGVWNLSLLAVPVGQHFPPSTSLACAAAVIPRAAPIPAAVNSDVSSFSSSLATPAEAFGSPLHTLAGAAITLGVILFITFPAQLFNRTFEENYDEIRDITLRRLRWLRRFRRDAEREVGGPLRFGSFAAVVLVGALLGSLNDKGFGLNLRSAATYLAVVLAVLVGILVGAAVGIAYRRLRRHPVEARLHALPAGLAVAAVCVIISRLSSFEPGYLYGVIAGLAFQGTLAKHEQGHTVALSAIASLSVAVLAWLIWVPVGHAAAAPGSSFALVLLADLLGSIFVGGLVGNVIGLMPLSFLPGGTLIEWNRGAWAATFAVAVFGLVEVELRPQSTAAHPGGAPVVTAVVLFILFGGSTAALRGYFSRREHRKHEEEAPPDDMAAPAQPAVVAAAPKASPVAKPAATRIRKPVSPHDSQPAAPPVTPRDHQPASAEEG